MKACGLAFGMFFGKALISGAIGGGGAGRTGNSNGGGPAGGSNSGIAFDDWDGSNLLGGVTGRSDPDLFG